MIFADIDDLVRYTAVNPSFAKAFEWLKNTDLTKLEVGKVVIDGTHVYANVQKYTTKNVEDSKFEAHRNYIDIQLLVKGAEKIDYAPVNTLTDITDPYNYDKDCVKMKGNATQSVTIEPGNACVLFPEDGHRPCQHPDGKTPTEVVKICMKIKL
ncbi:MAG: YhcH/YjgK/YiaL family protein [Treponema sp.]|nr:YhcH/YjgK/YiaL family protein [Treponema sp.]